jgi:hypothetical protein
MDRTMAADPCWRRERGKWHFSLGHCHEMGSSQIMVGIWSSGFENSSFYPAGEPFPAADDWKRPIVWLEVDEAKVEKMLGRKLQVQGTNLVAIKFRGRKTRYPMGIDCYGGRDYAVVVDRLLQARYLGQPPYRKIHFPKPSELPPYKPIKLSGEGGVVGRMEREALARCAPRPRDIPQNR